jgi:AICAR transformylase/IMP cyclohydrolase PurH
MGGILARRNRPDDLEALRAHGIATVDLVVVNLYPFAKAAARRDIAFDALVEEIDIGGPSMVRAAPRISAMCSWLSSRVTMTKCWPRSIPRPGRRSR